MNSRTNTQQFLGYSRTLGEPGSTLDNRPLLNRIFRRRQTNNYLQLDEIVDPKADYERFRREGLVALNPRILYQAGRFTSRTKFFSHHREHAASCLGDQSINMPLLSTEAGQQLRRSGYKYMHLGAINNKN